MGRGRRGAVLEPGEAIAVSGTGEATQPRTALRLQEGADWSAPPLPPRRARAGAQVAGRALGGARGAQLARRDGHSAETS